MAAVIWGMAFIAQRAGMEYMGPFLFNGIRFFLGVLVLLPVLYFQRKEIQITKKDSLALITTGLILFMGASLQQVGIVYTTAGKTGFITGLYVVIVPLYGRILGQKIPLNNWIAAGLAVLGLYLLSIVKEQSINWGDAMVLIGAFFWAAHVQIIAKLAPRMNAIFLAAVQFLIVSTLSMMVGLLCESMDGKAIMQAWPMILYAGIFSVGVAYTIQVYAQKTVPPFHAALILSMESVVAAGGGWWLLNEILSTRALAGCGLMLTGMVLSQVYQIKKRANSL